MSAVRKKKSGWKDDPLAGTGASLKAVQAAVNVIVSELESLSPEIQARKQTDLLLIQRITDLVSGAGTHTEDDHPGAAMTGLYADQHTQFWYQVQRFVCPSEYVLPSETEGQFEYSVWRCESQNAFKRYFHQFSIVIPGAAVLISTDRREMDDKYEKKKVIYHKTTVYELAEIFVSALNAEYRRNQ